MKLDKLKQIIKEELEKLNKISEEDHCKSWDTVSGSEKGRSIFRKFCCRRGWKCCTRRRPKNKMNPCW